MDPSGQPFGARYLIEEQVGAGATGVVYRGRVRDDGTAVAVKVLRPELAEDPDVVARFVRERSLVVRLRHPHLVQTLDLVVDGGRAAIVMDWVGGGDLREELRTHGPMTPIDAARVLRQVLSALAVVHRAGVIHRDIKPANVLLDEYGGAHLSDFGIGRLLGGQSITSSSELIGTADYMAPELLRHEPATAAVDIYSTGCMLHELLTGEPPFPGTSLAVILLAHLNQAPQRPPGVSGEMWDLLRLMLAKDPAGRPSVDEAVALIDRAFPQLATERPSVPAPPTVRTVVPFDLARPRGEGRRRSRLAWWAAAAALALVLSVAAALLLWPRLDIASSTADAAPAATTTTGSTTVATATVTTSATTSATTTAPPSTTVVTLGAPVETGRRGDDDRTRDVGRAPGSSAPAPSAAPAAAPAVLTRAAGGPHRCRLELRARRGHPVLDGSSVRRVPPGGALVQRLAVRPHGRDRRVPTRSIPGTSVPTSSAVWAAATPTSTPTSATTCLPATRWEPAPSPPPRTSSAVVLTSRSGLDERLVQDGDQFGPRDDARQPAVLVHDGEVTEPEVGHEGDQFGDGGVDPDRRDGTGHDLADRVEVDDVEVEQVVDGHDPDHSALVVDDRHDLHVVVVHDHAGAVDGVGGPGASARHGP